MQRMFELLSVDASCTSSDGHMVWLQCDGRMALDEVMAMSDEEVLPMVQSMLELRQETLDKRSLERGKLIRILQVRDVEGLGIARVLQDVRALSRLQGLLQTVVMAYPESMEKILVMNTPTSFDALWKVVSHWLNERILQKIRFLGSGEHGCGPVAELAAEVGLEGMEAWARLRRDCPAGVDTMSLEAGRTAHVAPRVECKGAVVEWTFEVESMDVEFSILMLSQGASGPEVSEVVSPERVKGRVEGKASVDAEGLLWVTWSNAYSWMRGKEIRDIRVEVTPPQDPAPPDPAPSS